MINMMTLTEELEVLPKQLQSMNYEEKLDFLSDLLCEEWYTNRHTDYIRDVLDIFAKSLDK